MRVDYKNSFIKDIKRVKSVQVKNKIKEVLLRIEQAKTLHDISNIKKLSGRGSFYRIRIGDYRIGLSVKNEKLVLFRVLNRKDLYKYFP